MISRHQHAHLGQVDSRLMMQVLLQAQRVHLQASTHDSTKHGSFRCMRVVTRVQRCENQTTASVTGRPMHTPHVCSGILTSSRSKAFIDADVGSHAPLVTQLRRFRAAARNIACPRWYQSIATDRQHTAHRTPHTTSHITSHTTHNIQHSTFNIQHSTYNKQQTTKITNNVLHIPWHMSHGTSC
jgi:hypothetical protein